MNQGFEVKNGQSDSMTVTPRESVRNLQRYLRQLSYVYPEIPPVPVDGIFDTATRESLRSFQGLSGLPETGMADAETWGLLYEAYLDALFNASEPLGMPIFPQGPIHYTAKRGDEGFLVSSIQYLLREIGTLYDFPSDVSISGVFDEATELAVIELQRLFLLTPTGEVDKRLWNYLVGAYRAEDNAREDTT